MLKVVYTSTKQSFPGVQIIAGSLMAENPTNGLKFLSGTLAVGGGSAFDILSLHSDDYYDDSREGGYSYANLNWNTWAITDGPVLGKKADFVRSVMSNYGVTKPVMVNETNLRTTAARRATPLPAATAR